MTPHRRLGLNVIRLRNAKGLTQEKLAENSDLSRRYLQRIEAGVRNPTIDVIAKLRTGLQCSWEELLEGIINCEAAQKTIGESKEM